MTLQDIAAWDMIGPYVDTVCAIFREDYYRDTWDDEGRDNLMELDFLRGSSGRYRTVLQIKTGFKLEDLNALLEKEEEVGVNIIL